MLNWPGGFLLEKEMEYFWRIIAAIPEIWDLARWWWYGV
jgi:hypothetical protein